MASGVFVKKRRKLSLTSIILTILLAAAIIFSIVLAVNLKGKSNKVNDLNSSVKSYAAENTNLSETVSNQATTIDELNSKLTFFATPEEGAESSEAAVSSEIVNSGGNEGGAFPNLYAASKNTLENSEQKIAYLTFDDGPSNLTPTVLDILEQYNAKATFFVIGTTNEEYQQYYKAIVDRGHTLALHSYTHNYQKIYASVDAFLGDYQQLFDLVYEKTGQVPSLFRFPGGSKNAYNSGVRSALMQEMENRGFIFYDWNVSCGDGSSKATKDSIYQKVMDEVQGYTHPVILMHDGQGHQETIAALPDIMKSLSEQGYVFEALNPDMKPTQFPR